MSSNHAASGNTHYGIDPTTCHGTFWGTLAVVLSHGTGAYVGKKRGASPKGKSTPTTNWSRLLGLRSLSSLAPPTTQSTRGSKQGTPRGLELHWLRLVSLAAFLGFINTVQREAGRGGTVRISRVLPPSPLSWERGRMFATAAFVAGILGAASPAGASINARYQIVSTVTGGPVNFGSIAGIPGTDSFWAVGNAGGLVFGGAPYIVEQTGSTSKQVPSPAGSICHLVSVSAASASSAWVVGGCPAAVILNWNGKSWRRVAVPVPSEGALNAVMALSPTDAWAVGEYFSSTTNGYRTLVDHWNGTSWKQVVSPSPNPGEGDNDLQAVTALSSSDVWAVGDSFSLGAKADVTLILHWNGQAWSQVPSPNPGLGHQVDAGDSLQAVDSTSPSAAWAVGHFYDSTNTVRALSLHWNGKTWTPAALPALGSDKLDGVVSASPSSAWAVGSLGLQTLILHWNGKTWTKTATPNMAGGRSSLVGVATSSAGDIRAVGTHATEVHYETAHSIELRWNGTVWIQE
jgi:hypothetical protein